MKAAVLRRGKNVVGQHRQDPRSRSRREQRVRSRLRHAIRVARKYGLGSGRSRFGTASGSWGHRTPSRPRRPRSCAGDHLGSDDFDGETAERYGCVNRALPDAELDGFVDKTARRIATFDRRPIEAARNLVNRVSLPLAKRLPESQKSFLIAATWPETQRRFKALFERRLNEPWRDGESLRRAARNAPRQVATRDLIWTLAGRPVSARSLLSVTSRSGVPGGSARIAMRMSGCSFSSARIVVTRIAETPNRRASSARFFTSPRSRRPCHSSACRSKRTTRGNLSSRSAFRFRSLARSMTRVVVGFLLESHLACHRRLDHLTLTRRSRTNGRLPLPFGSMMMS